VLCLDEQFAALARRAAEEDLGDAVEEALTLANWASGELLALSELTGCLAGMPSEDLGAYRVSSVMRGVTFHHLTLHRFFS
jgi:hypothetical protein